MEKENAKKRDLKILEKMEFRSGCNTIVRTLADLMLKCSGDCIGINDTKSAQEYRNIRDILLDASEKIDCVNR